MKVKKPLDCTITEAQFDNLSLVKSSNPLRKHGGKTKKELEAASN